MFGFFGIKRKLVNFLWNRSKSKCTLILYVTYGVGTIRLNKLNKFNKLIIIVAEFGGIPK